MTVVVVVDAAFAAIIIVGSSQRMFGPRGFSMGRTVPAIHMQTNNNYAIHSMILFLLSFNSSFALVRVD